MNSTIDKIIRGEMRPFLPDKRSEDFYGPELRQMSMPVEYYVEHYRTRFVIPEFSSKTKYYKKVIDAAIIDTLNSIYTQYNTASDARIAYRYKTLLGDVKRNAVQVYEMIQSNGYFIETLIAPGVNFKENRQDKECSFIFNYLLLSMMVILLDFQEHFEDKLDSDKCISLDDFYTNVLGIMPPSTHYIEHIEVPENVFIAKPEKSGTTRVSSKNNVFWFDPAFKSQPTYMINLWMSMTSHKVIENCAYEDFKPCFSGKMPKKKLKWNTYKDLLSYFIKKLTDLPVVHYGTSKWEATCNTFTDSDGNPYDPENLRKQQKPKEGTDTIDAVLSEAYESVTR